MAGCGVCGRGNCVPSFHSFEEQERADRLRDLREGRLTAAERENLERETDSESAAKQQEK